MAITITFNFTINKLIMQSCNMIMVCNINYTTKAWELIWLERIQSWCKIGCKFVFSKLYFHRHLHSTGFKFKFCYNEKIKINFLPLVDVLRFLFVQYAFRLRLSIGVIFDHFDDPKFQITIYIYFTRQLERLSLHSSYMNYRKN